MTLNSISEQIPSEINGKTTDVIPVYDLSALARPVECGASIGHFEITAGTLGCLVKKNGGPDDERFILLTGAIYQSVRKHGRSQCSGPQIPRFTRY